MNEHGRAIATDGTAFTDTRSSRSRHHRRRPEHALRGDVNHRRMVTV